MLGVIVVVVGGGEREHAGNSLTMHLHAFTHVM